MKKAILAGVFKSFNEDGVLTPNCSFQAILCCNNTQAENDGYDAVQVGFADIREK